MGLVPERPRVDHPVDRPELYGPRGLQVTGTNGRQLDHFYRSSSVTNRRNEKELDQAELLINKSGAKPQAA